jgi:hypothetical protein
MRILVAVLILTAGAVTSLAQAPGGEQPTLEQLIQQLGSKKYAEREAAARALDARGTDALPALQAACRSDDLEVRRRAGQIVERIQRRLETGRLLGGKRVRLVYDNTSVAEAVSDFSAKTGVPLQLDGDLLGLSGRKITLDTGEVPFWEAFEQFCHKAGLAEKMTAPQTPPSSGGHITYTIHANGRVITAYGGPNGGRPQTTANGPMLLVDARTKNTPTHVAGALRIRALPSSFHVAPPSPVIAIEELLPQGRGGGQPPVQGRGLPGQPSASPPEPEKVVGFAVEVRPEPKMSWDGIVRMSIDRAVDEHGQVLVQREPYLAESMNGFSTFNEVMVWDVGDGRPRTGTGTSGAQTAPAYLQRGQKESTLLKEVRGTLTVQVQKQQPLITVDEIQKAAGKTFKSADGRSLKVVDAQWQGTQLRLHVILEGPNVVGMNGQVLRVVRGKRGGMTIVSGESDGTELTLLDAAGNVLKMQKGEPNYLPRDDGGVSVEYRLFCQVNAGKGEPAKLVYSGTRPVLLEVPFTLRDVPVSLVQPPQRTPSVIFTDDGLAVPAIQFLPAPAQFVPPPPPPVILPPVQPVPAPIQPPQAVPLPVRPIPPQVQPAGVGQAVPVQPVPRRQ